MDDTVNLTYSCSCCSMREDLSLDPEDVAYANDAMEELGWVLTYENEWLCPSCAKEEE